MVNNMMSKWYSVKEDNVLNISEQKKYRDVFILDEIGGYGIYAKNFIRELNQIDADVINVHMDSVGGNITDGIAIYNALRGHKSEIHVHINGIAGSIASIIILAGDKIYIPENAGIFLHLPMYAEMDYPNRQDMTEAIEVLGNFERVLTSTYMKHTGKDEDYIRQLLEAETWLFGQEAVDFIGDQAEVVEKIAMVARMKDLEKYPFSASLPSGDGEQDEPEVNNMKDEIKAEATEEVVEASVEATEEVVEVAEEVVDSSSPDHEEAVDAIIDADLEKLAEEESEEEELEEVDAEAEEAEAVLACEKERVSDIIALAEKYAVDASVALQAVKDEVSVDDFKDSLLDVLAKEPTSKKIVSSPEGAKASVSELREQLENATDPKQKYLLAKQIKSLR
jgi:ATP-dependent protease ClpP protease subunit